MLSVNACWMKVTSIKAMHLCGGGGGRVVEVCGLCICRNHIHMSCTVHLHKYTGLSGLIVLFYDHLPLQSEYACWNMVRNM